MTFDRPLVSIAMPVFNPDSTFRVAILSLIHQDLQNWELMIIDDGSTNDINQWIDDLSDPRIFVLKNKVNLGIAKRLNECIDRARGIYFARMDADDISFPSRLSKQVALLEKFSNIDLVATRSLVIDSNNNVLGILPYAPEHSEIISKPWRGINMPHPTWMGRTEWFRSNKYQIPASYLSEDQELLLRASKSSQYVTINEILFAYRIRDYVDSKKLSKTRSAVLKFQFRYFYSRREYLNIFMSLLNFSLKKIADIFLSRSGGLGHLNYSLATESELYEWRCCLNQLSS